MTTIVVGTCSNIAQASPSIFSQQDVKQDRFIILAVPRGSDAHSLLILEQLSNQRPCWRVNNDAYQTVEPLLLKFDFTGICSRSTDSNGYSIRTAGQDLGLKYTLRLIYREGVAVLVGSPSDRGPDIEIGRTRGIVRDFMKIDLNPDWRLTRRTYKGKPVGHLYLTNNLALKVILARAAATSAPEPIAPTPTLPSGPLGTTPLPNTTPPGLTSIPVTPPQTAVSSPPPTPSMTIPVIPPPATATPVPVLPPVEATPPVVTVSPVASPSPLPIPAALLPVVRAATEVQPADYALASINPPAATPAFPRPDPNTIAPRVPKLATSSEIYVPPTPASTQTPSSRPLAEEINRLYREVLGREADAAGLAYYIKQVEQGRSLADIRRNMEISPEAQKLRQARTTQPPEAKVPSVTTNNKTPVTPIAINVPPPEVKVSPPNRDGYFAVVPTSQENLPRLAQKIQQLGATPARVLQRGVPRGPHVAVGPFTDRATAERWSRYLRSNGLDARVYFGP
ncbi:hypothetical protein BST81_04970 [Leptolyngbya sp. 'hensonii']|nr:hypothetical protein BST81_04970 [Leptolyngbya sp. 'hensonii']